MRAHPDAGRIAVPGALCEPFVAQVLRAARGRRIALVVADGTRVFLTHRSRDWYARQGVTIAARAPIDLRAITVNPVAPLSHRLDSPTLRRLIAEAVPDVPVLDVLDPAYGTGSVRPGVSPCARAG